MCAVHVQAIHLQFHTGPLIFPRSSCGRWHPKMLSVTITKMLSVTITKPDALQDAAVAWPVLLIYASRRSSPQSSSPRICQGYLMRRRLIAQSHGLRLARRSFFKDRVPLYPEQVAKLYKQQSGPDCLPQNCLVLLQALFGLLFCLQKG